MFHAFANNPITYTDPDGRLTVSDEGDYIFLQELYPDGHAVVRIENSALDGGKVRYIYGFLLANDGTKIRARYKTERESNVGDNTDCHGFTFTNGTFWINNAEIEALLKGDGYQQVVLPSSGDIMIQRNEKGDVIHSAKVILYDRQTNDVLVEEAMGNLLFKNSDGQYSKTRLKFYKIDKARDAFYKKPGNVKITEPPKYKMEEFYEAWNNL